MGIVFEIEKDIAEDEKVRAIRSAVEGMLRENSADWKVSLRRTLSFEGYWLHAETQGFERSRAMLDLSPRRLSEVFAEWLREWALGTR